MARTGFVGRHRTALASGVALAVATAAVVTYAVSADGYKAHEADLNDGGVWVVNGDLGWTGRINKPINQLDGVVVGEGAERRIDVVQDGAAVVGLDLGSSRLATIDPSRLVAPDNGMVAVPTGGDVQMGGGTLASLDRQTGHLWAVRYDPRTGRFEVGDVDRQSDPLHEAGAGAALAVSLGGTVVVTSADEGTISTLRQVDGELASPTEAALPDDAGSPDAVTTVGERVVALDTAEGVLRVLDGATAEVPAESELQQPGPAASSVLVGTRDSLLSVDLDTGELTTIAEKSGGAVEPVRLGACVYGAWSGGSGAVAVQCGTDEANVSDLGGDATRLAFRVNRGEIVLNDSLSGTVWDVQRAEPVPIDNWEAFIAKKQDKDKDKEDESRRDADRRPPQAKPDTYGVRPGRTSVLHPLDNDSAPEGRILSIVSVGSPGDGVRTAVSPDGQSVQVVMPPGARRPVRFDYTIDDGRNQHDRATVTVGVRGPGEDARPEPRKGFKPRQWPVPAGGALSVPALSDWRDDADSDALVLDSAVAEGGEETGAEARTTAEGRIRFTAPSQVETTTTVRVRYGVTDGHGPPVRRTMQFVVRPTSDRTGFPPVAEPDVVRGEVGSPIEIRPLANDLPGSDPFTPNAELALGGRVPPQPNAKVTTDLEKGLVTFTSEKAGTYFLDYDAAYGHATFSKSKIRVDVLPRPRRPDDPVAMPDTVMLYGTSPALVDVLANDLDPSGDLLVVQDAVTESEQQLDVAVVNGRWLRFSARSRLAPATQVVRYTVTNGRAGATGEVTVTQRDKPPNNIPVTASDRVVVRAGTAVSAPVLDNDVSPSGDRLVLATDVTDRPGELDVTAPVDYKGDAGQAFVSGRVVRYVAPGDVTERETFKIRYTAVSAGEGKAVGQLVVSVVPAGTRNSAPRPPTLEGRAVAGDVVSLRLRGSDVDPEGDPVAITGITSPPRLGRLVSTTANALRYQAYPGSVGTDEFTYAVVDTHGAVATGTARVAVVPLADPQPPLAVDDVLTVHPGRTATFDPMANDHVARGVDAQLELVEPPEGVSLDQQTGLVRVPTPEEVGDQPTIQVVYSLSNGIEESRATMTLRVRAGVENPPVISDAYGSAKDSRRVTVDVLEGAYDPDGDAEDIVVADVFAEDGTADHTADQVTADRLKAPRVLPFRVEDGQGTSALAQVYVPATGGQVPYVRPGALIKVDAGKQVSGSLEDHVVNPSGGALRLTSRNGVSASPEQLTATAKDTTSFEVAAGPGYLGPGAALVEVTTATDPSGNEDPSDPSDGITALLSIPVQVGGDDTPELTCPSDTVIPIAAGEEHRIDVQSLCKVFTLDPRDSFGLEYTAAWAKTVDGVEMTPLQGSVFSVEASRDADGGGGGVAVLDVRAGDSNTEQIAFRLDKAAPPRMLPIRVDDMKAGEPRTVDLSRYFIPGVSDPQPRVVSIEQVSGQRAPASSSGASVTLRPGPSVEGRVEYRVVMSDVSGNDPPLSRTAEGRLAFEVRGVPGAPGEPIPFENEKVGEIEIGWQAPDDTGGSPIRNYEMIELKTGRRQTCPQTRCFFRGLEPGKKYTFKVRARNDVGYGEWSGESIEAVVDTKPGRVRNIRMAGRGDGSITLAWDRPAVTGNKITGYYVSWRGGSVGPLSGDRERTTIRGLSNNESYTFSIQADNKIGLSDVRESEPMQPLGTPAAPLNVTATDLTTGQAATTVRVSWSETSPEGPGPALYTLYVSKDGAAARRVPGCAAIPALSCNDNRSYDGSTYTYYVKAQNQPSPEAPNESVLSLGGAFDAVGKPANWGSWSATPTGVSGQVRLSYTVPDSRGDQSRVDVLVDGLVADSFEQRGQASALITVPSNDTSFGVSLRVCNEKPTGCTTSQAQSVQSYGPLTGPVDTLDAIAVTAVNGKDISWLISGTHNGNQAVLEVRINGVLVDTVRPEGTGRFQVPRSFTAERYDQDVTISATLYDDAPAGRGSVTEVLTTRSGPPPRPTVSVSEWTACGDLPVSDPKCQGEGAQGPVCLENSCGKARIVTTGYIEPYTCQAEAPWPWVREFQRRGFGATDTQDNTPWYFYGGQVVRVRCFSDTQDDAVTTLTWPN